MATQQEHRGKKQQFDTKHSPSTPSSQTEKEKQQNKDTRASMAQSTALSGEDHTQVAELAYALYEQRGRKDGHDLEDWFNAEQRIMEQGRSGRSFDEVW
ncbi:MAG: DUF2934 domain-containing protein [Nitrospirota bacterium]